MNNRFSRILSFICAVMMICAVCVWTYAEEEAPEMSTNLSSAVGPALEDKEPEQKPGEEQEQPEAEPAEEPAEEPEETPAEEPAAEDPEVTPAEEPVEEQEETPAEEPAEEPEETPAEEPAEESEETSVEEPAEEPTESPAEEPAEESEDTHAEKQAEESVEEPKEEPVEEQVASVEVIITKALGIGDSWEGKVSKTKPAVLKLDIKQPGTVHMLVEGKDIWTIVEKADRQTENPPRKETDPETGRTIISWEAETGSYLITLGPVEPNLLGLATVSIMDNKAYTAWEEAQEEKEQGPKNEPDEELDEEPEGEPKEENRLESETMGEPVEEPENDPSEDSENEPAEDPEKELEEEEHILPENRNAEITITWDDEHPAYGSVAHFDAKLTGYEDLEYTLQWQWSMDDETWTDVAEATDTKMDVVYTQENGSYYWRLIVYIFQPTED